MVQWPAGPLLKSSTRIVESSDAVLGYLYKARTVMSDEEALVKITDSVLDIGVLLSTSAMLVQTVKMAAYNMPAADGLAIGGGVSALSTGFSVAYLVMVLIKIHLLGVRRFWSFTEPLRNRFDVVAALSLLALECSPAWLTYPSKVLSWSVIDDAKFDVDVAGRGCLGARAVVFARVLRVLRLLYRVPELRNLLTSLVSVVSAFSTVVGLLVVLFHFYATIGVQLFGGVDQSCVKGRNSLNCDEEKLLPNFNDFYSAFVSLFVIMVTGWHQNLTELVRRTSACSLLYFITFHILADMIVLNLIVSLILEAYEQIHMLQLEEEEEGNSCMKQTSTHVLSTEDIYLKMFQEQLESNQALADILCPLSPTRHNTVMFGCESDCSDASQEDFLNAYFHSSGGLPEAEGVMSGTDEGSPALSEDVTPSVGGEDDRMRSSALSRKTDGINVSADGINGVPTKVIEEDSVVNRITPQFMRSNNRRATQIGAALQKADIMWALGESGTRPSERALGTSSMSLGTEEAAAAALASSTAFERRRRRFMTFTARAEAMPVVDSKRSVQLESMGPVTFLTSERSGSQTRTLAAKPTQDVAAAPSNLGRRTARARTSFCVTASPRLPSPAEVTSSSHPLTLLERPVRARMRTLATAYDRAERVAAAATAASMVNVRISDTNNCNSSANMINPVTTACNPAITTNINVAYKSNSSTDALFRSLTPKSILKKPASGAQRYSKVQRQSLECGDDGGSGESEACEAVPKLQNPKTQKTPRFVGGIDARAAAIAAASALSAGLEEQMIREAEEAMEEERIGRIKAFGN